MKLDKLKGKKVLVTGHTGFKGSWMCKLLMMQGAQVSGYALEPPTTPALFQELGLAGQMDSVTGDIRDYEHLFQVVKERKPEIVIHMAAQPIVRESYQNPRYTYETNVMGTVNILEAVRNTDSVSSLVNVTTDKVYLNREWQWGYRENEELNGYDPYSNSKSCSELATNSYRQSFFQERKIAISTMRAGNVVGGGDFAKDRIIPDCVRAAREGQEIILRNPNSIRPYQHVLEPVAAYLLMALAQQEDKTLEGPYNIGPDEASCVTTAQMASMFCDSWKEVSGKEIHWRAQGDGGPHEAGLLKLDCAKIKHALNWQPVWDVKETIHRVTQWYYAYATGDSSSAVTEKQISEYLSNFS